MRSGHAFSTRNGGVSYLEHTESLNLALDRGDERWVVLENLSIFAEEAGFKTDSIVSFPQIHSTRILKVGKEHLGLSYKDSCPYECDGYITDESNITLGIKTADCLPILFEARKGKDIVAVGAVHAGWKGSFGGIAKKCADMLCLEYGVEKKDIFAALGPCICQKCYEVGSDVRETCLSLLKENRLPSSLCDAVFKRGEKEGKYYCDLSLFNRLLLQEIGIPRENIEELKRCTFCEPDIFFSHRYSGGKRGTMLSVIFKNA